MRLLLSAALALCIGAGSATAQSDFEKARQLVQAGDYSGALPLVRSAAAANPKNAQIQLFAGDVFTEMDKLDSAVIFYRKAWDANDEVNEGRKLASALAKVGKSSEAVTLMKGVVKENKDDVNALLGLAEAFISADSLTQADVNIRKAQKLAPDNAEAFVALGDLYFAQKVYELAKVNYEDALTRNPAMVQVRFRLAQVYYKLGVTAYEEEAKQENLRKAVEEYDEVSKQDPSNAVAFLEKGRMLHGAKRHVDAARALYKYVGLRPEGDYGRWILAQSLVDIRQFDSASVQLDYLRKNASVDTIRRAATPLYARSMFFLKSYPQAKEAYLAAQTMGPVAQDDVERLGYSAILTKDTTTAIKAFQQAIEGPDAKCTLMMRVGLLLRDRRDYQPAIDVFRKRLARCSDSLDSRVRYFIGLSWYEANNLDSAIAVFNEAVALDSGNVFALVQLGASLNEKADVAGAKAVLNTAIAKAQTQGPDSKSQLSRAYATLANILLTEKNYADLKKMATAWIASEPASEAGNLYLAVSHQGLNEKDPACKYYREVLKLNPANDTAKQNLSSLGC